MSAPVADSPKEVRIKDKVITIPSISGWKFLEAAELIAQITEQLPELYNGMEEFRLKRIETGTRVWPRAAALVQFPEQLARITDEEWAAMGEELTLPGGAPSTQEQVAQVFPQALAKAKPLVVRLLSVLTIPGEELEAAVAAGGEGLATALDKWGNFILLNGRMADLLKLVVMAIDAFKAEAQDDPEVSGLVGKVTALLSPVEEPTEEPEESQPDATAETPNSDSSSPSPESSDGPSETPSTDIAGTPSEPSMIGSTAGA